MAGISNAPFRLLMNELGAGGTVSELISCHGINHGNEKTLRMLKIDDREKTIGLQLFGEDSSAMAHAAARICKYEPQFVDINMGCPVRKITRKGAGAALLDKPEKLGHFFSHIKKNIPLPLTIKIRIGPKEEQLNAPEVIRIAKEEGIEFVAVHGRTRAQQYKGSANWNYLENLAQNSPLPLIGNGDLHCPITVRKRIKKTKCSALMLARGSLRHPFIFLEALDESLVFYPKDYWEVAQRLYHLLIEHYHCDRIVLIQIKKHIVWFASGFPKSSFFREKLFRTSSLEEVLILGRDYFHSLPNLSKQLDYSENFMKGGHG